MLPPVFPLGFGSMLYLLLAYITGLGLWQFFELRRGNAVRTRSLVPLGAAALVVGIIACVQHYRLIFQAIEAQGDITPATVAGAFKDALRYPIMGLLGLAIAFVFKFTNTR